MRGTYSRLGVLTASIQDGPAPGAEERPWPRQIVIEVETPGDSRTMFTLRIDSIAIGEGLTAAQAHLLVGEILDRITLPKSGGSDEKTRRP